MNDSQKKTPERSDIIIRKAIHKALFTRNVQKNDKPTGSSEKPAVNPMLKRFGFEEKQEPAPEIPKIEPESVPAPSPIPAPVVVQRKREPVTLSDLLKPNPKSSKPQPVETELDPALLALINEDIAEARAEKQASQPVIQDMRSAPLPPVKMAVPKRSFWATIKSKFLPVTARVSRKSKEMKTGLTNRQRIKRYNSIHEGGHNSPISKGNKNNSS